MSKFSEFIDDVIEWFRNIGEDVVDFVKPLAKEIAANGGALLLEAAHQAVLAAEASGGSGRDKFDAAQKSVIAALEAKSLPIVLNAINGAIEAAVAVQKAKAA